MNHTTRIFVAAMLLYGSPLRGQTYAGALSVRDDNRHRTVTISAGPYALPAGVNYNGTLVTVSEMGAVPVNGWLKTFELDVVDRNGVRIDAPVFHHAGLFAPSERDLFSATMRRVVAFGSETEAIRLPGETGYRVTPGDSLLLVGAFFNTTPIAYDSVYLRITMTYADARLDNRHANALPLYLDVLPPGKREYDVPPGISQRSWDWSPAVEGKLVGLGGHLHKYGRTLVLEDVTSGDTMWVGHAKYDLDGELLGVSRKVFLRGKTMRPDHSYRLTAIYDNPTDDVVKGAMGKIGGLFIAKGNAQIAAVDRNHPDYVVDYGLIFHHTHEAEHVHAVEQKVTQ